MIHQITTNFTNKTMCGIKLECPILNIDSYDDRTVVDKNEIIVTGLGVRHDFIEPTCAECSRIKKQLLYHCSVHGYLSGREVTYKEKCVYCGNAV